MFDGYFHVNCLLKLTIKDNLTCGSIYELQDEHNKGGRICTGTVTTPQQPNHYNSDLNPQEPTQHTRDTQTQHTNQP